MFALALKIRCGRLMRFALTSQKCHLNLWERKAMDVQQTSLLCA